MHPTILKKSLEQRRQMYESIIKEYPNKIPIIITPFQNTKSIFKKNNFLTDPTSTVNGLIIALKKRAEIQATQSMFLTINKTILSGSTTMAELYNNHRDKEDGFLYLSYRMEDTFG